MVRKPSRRAYLETAAAGIGAAAGYVTIANLRRGGQAQTGTSTGEMEETRTEATAGAGDETETTQSSESRTNPGGPGRQLEAFEDLSEFSTSSGALTADTDTQYVGSQSAKLTLEGGEDVSGARPVSVDMDGTLPSIAVRLSNPADVTFYLIASAPDYSNRVVYQQTGFDIQEPTNWFRLSPGVSPESSGSPDLSDVRTLRYKFITHSDETIDCWIDDLRAVPTPDRGKLVLQWDDSRDDYYSKAFDDVEQYSYPMSHATITGQVGDDGRMTLDEMREIQRAGGEIGSHTHGNIDVSEHSLSTVRDEVAQSRQWLNEHDFDGDFIVWPHVNFTGEHIDIAEEHFSFAGSNSQADEHNFQGPGFDPMVYTRLIGYDLETMKRFTARLDEHNGIGVINLHGYRDDNTVDRSEFQEFLEYVDANHVATGGVDVVTFQELAEFI